MSITKGEKFKLPEVSIVIPLYNAEKYIGKVLEGIFHQGYLKPIEVIVVNDGSTDKSAQIVEEYAKNHSNLKIIHQKNLGPVRATNTGIIASTNEIVCSIDADAVIEKGWLSKVVSEFQDEKVGAVGGYIKTANSYNFWAKMAGYDLEYRYDKIKSKFVSQVSSCNTAYRKSILKEIGFFNPRYRYGYDNDTCYKLSAKGYKLVLLKQIGSSHFWKESFFGYLHQQYNVGFGRMQLVSRYWSKWKGDTVSGLGMIIQVPLTLLLALSLVFSATVFLVSLTYIPLFWLPLTLFLLILIGQFREAIELLIKKQDKACLLLPAVHLLRNFAWVWALIRWFWCIILERESRNN